MAGVDQYSVSRWPRVADVAVLGGRVVSLHAENDGFGTGGVADGMRSVYIFGWEGVGPEGVKGVLRLGSVPGAPATVRPDGDALDVAVYAVSGGTPVPSSPIALCSACREPSAAGGEGKWCVVCKRAVAQTHACPPGHCRRGCMHALQEATDAMHAEAHEEKLADLLEGVELVLLNEAAHFDVLSQATHVALRKQFKVCVRRGCVPLPRDREQRAVRALRAT